jgi:hypothetical protein
MTSDSFLGTPLPPEEPQAANPPRGAYVYFFLASRIEGEVRLEILDAGGKQVRRYSSADKTEPPPARPAIAPRWFPKPQSLSVEPGLHRFVWDLRYGRTGDKSSGEDGEDDGEGPAFLGPLVMPGSYTVKLIAGGREFVQPLKVTMDPRSSATPAELAAQFDLANRVFDDMIRARKAFAAATSLHTKLDGIHEKLDSNHAALREPVAALSTELNDLLTGGKAGPEEGLRYTSAALTAALSAVESADRTPPSQVRALYAESLRSLSREMEKWKTLESGALPKLNQQLKDAGLAPVQIAELEREAEESIAK